MPANFARDLTHHTRTHHADIYLGILLTFIAGAINAGGFLAIGFYTSHMSGIVSSIADYTALHYFTPALYGVLFVMSFICGAVTSSFIINFARTHDLPSKFALVVMLEAILLLAFGLSASGEFGLIYFSVNITISLLCFIMGLQNALISKISKSKIRTTHITGIVTDIGIEIGRWLNMLVRKNYFPRPVRKNKLLFLSSQLLAFLGGGLIGAFSFKYIGFITTIPLALLLGVIALLPIWEDIKRKKRSSF